MPTSCPDYCTPKERNPLPTEYEGGWAPELVWTLDNTEKSPVPVKV
jgi:hypothetical protein